MKKQNTISFPYCRCQKKREQRLIFVFQSSAIPQLQKKEKNTSNTFLGICFSNIWMTLLLNINLFIFLIAIFLFSLIQKQTISHKFIPPYTHQTNFKIVFKNVLCFFILIIFMQKSVRIITIKIWSFFLFWILRLFYPKF